MFASNNKRVTRSQQGSALVVVLLVFMIVLLLAGAAAEIMFIENKVAIGNSHEELARQAADAGIAVARDVLMNYLTAGASPPLLEDIYLHNGCRVHITYDLSEISEGRVMITSRGFAEDDEHQISATRAAIAGVLVRFLPDYTIRAGQLRLTGKYHAAVAATSINTLAEQDWDVDQSTLEARLDGDPLKPEYYPLNGQPYEYFYNQRYVNHPYFNPGEQTWSGISIPDYTWSIVYPVQDEVEPEHNISQSFLEIAPFYMPRGYVETLNTNGQSAWIGLKNGWNDRLEPAELGILFDDSLPTPRWGEWPSEQYYQSELVRTLYNTRAAICLPDKELSSVDFLKLGQVVSNVEVPACGAESISRFRQLARSDPEWQYLNSDSTILSWNTGKYEVMMDGLDHTSIFFDCSAGDTVVLNYNSVLPPTPYPIQDWLAGDIGTFFEQIRNQHKNVLIVSPADLELIMDSRMLNQLRSDWWLYVISSGSVDLKMEPASGDDGNPVCQDIRALVMAGDDLRLNSVNEYNRYSGLLSTADEMSISLYPGSTAEDADEEQYLQICQNEWVVDRFPETWSYLGMGAILDYRYIH